jgi:bifunctional N-acetylglucosamine-1-phosphate-uridyltransferase/glucosamine-1-phosphate-acetyltransferase GlmU-like protein
MNVSVLILAAGQTGTESTKFDYPPCLSEIGGLSLLEKIIDNTRLIEDAKYAFVFLKNEVDCFHLDKVAKILTTNPYVIRIPESTQGSACTALLAASQLDPDSELLIISTNELVDTDLSSVVSNFRGRKLDGGVLVFPSVHPRYSYVRVDSQGFVTEAAQQDPISKNATAGIFWFSKTKDFVAASMEAIRKNASLSNKFYIAPTFNELILKHAKVGVLDLDANKYIPLKSERQMHQFEHGSKI